MMSCGSNRDEIIQSWINTVVQEGERGRGHELHVDQIDRLWELESTWVSAALESFDIACRIRDGIRSDTKWTVIVGFFLTSESYPLGMGFHNRQEMEQVLSDIPPALFLWPTGDEFWIRVGASKNGADNSTVKILNAGDFFGAKHEMFKSIFLETIWSGREDYLRVFYVAG
jgi:hypothetical protein